MWKQEISAWVNVLSLIEVKDHVGKAYPEDEIFVRDIAIITITTQAYESFA